MASSQRYGNHHGRGGSIAVAAIATAGGVAALFAYHTSPGHAADATPAADTANAVPAAAGTGTDTDGMNAAAQGTTQKTKATHSAKTDAKGAAAGSGKASAASAVAKTYLGAPANTRWGVVQVKITVKNGKITSAKAVQRPHSTQHSIDINNYAVPVLNKEAVKAGSAKIDSVSGATVTSGGYQTSLQSAVNMAHL